MVECYNSIFIQQYEVFYQGKLQKEIEIEIIDENTVKFNGQTHKKLAVPTIEETKAKLKKSNPNLSDEELEEKASEFVNKIKSKNYSID